MAAADNNPTVPANRDPRSSTAEPSPRVGEQRHPYNGGELGFTYTIYRFYDATNRLLYLGQSGRIRQRMVDLEAGSRRGLPLGHDDGPKPWWREAVRIELQHLPPGTTETEAMAEEARQIELERPVYNRSGADGHFDRERQDQVLEHAHFESDVATAEHERHDGLVRDLTQIEIESRRAADRIRPGGSALLDALPRQGHAKAHQTWADQTAAGFHAEGYVGGEATHQPRPDYNTAVHVTADSDTPELAEYEDAGRRLERRRYPTPTFYPTQDRGNGPGSRLGMAIVAIVLAATVAVALIVSLQAAF